MKRLKLTLKAIRINNKWSQEEAANKYGVSVATIQNWESYKTVPNAIQIDRILKSTKLHYDDIIFLPKEYGKTVKVLNHQ